MLAHHYPNVPNVGDMTAHDWRQYRGRCDVLAAGTPCQAFSVAGRRESLADSRGNLTLKFTEICDDIDPRVIIWENVPGVLSTKDNAFGCLLGALVGEPSAIVPDGKWTNAGLVVGPRRSAAWRVLDAQYFGVAQRRRRVFLVASPRTSGIDPAEILFEFEGVRRDSPPSRGAQEGVAAGAGEGAPLRSEWGGDSIAGTVSAKWRKGTGGPSGDECQNLVAGAFIPPVSGTITSSFACGGPNDNEAARGMYVAHSLRGEGFDASEDGTGRGTPLAPIASSYTGSRQQSRNLVGGDISNALRSADGGSSKAFVLQWAVRRLTPRECERLQGMPDDYTRIPYPRFKKGVSMGKLLRDWLKYLARGGTKDFFECHPSPPDGPRYKSIGNGMAVPNLHWLLRRVDIVVKRQRSADGGLPCPLCDVYGVLRAAIAKAKGEG